MIPDFSRYSVKSRLVFFLGLAALLVYANAIPNDYTFDDFIVIKYNSIVTRGVQSLPEIFTTSYFKGNLESPNDYYRPLSLAMFAIEYQLSGGNPLLSHVVSVLLFGCCVLVLFFFLDDLLAFRKTGVAFLASLLFALHPLNTEVVANIKSRDQLLCFLFAFVALLCFFRYLRSARPGFLLYGLSCFFLSLLSKETALTFVPVCALVFFFYQNSDLKKSTWILVGATIVSLVYLVIRYRVLAANHAGLVPQFSLLENALVGAPSLESRLATAFLVLGRYLSLLVIPYPLVCDYSFHTIPYTHFTDPRVWPVVLFLVISCIAALYRLFTKPRDPYAFMVLFFIISMALFSNTFFLIGTVMGERLLFFGLISFCLFVAFLLEHWLRNDGNDAVNWIRSPKALAVILPVLLVYATLTVARNRDWKDNRTLFTADIRKAPGNCRLWYNLGTGNFVDAMELPAADSALKKQMITQSLSELRNAIRIYADYALAWSEMGSIYYNTGITDSAEYYTRTALALNSKDAVAAENLSAIYFRSKRYDSCLRVCRLSLAINDQDARTWRNMGNCFLLKTEYDSAIQYIRKAIQLDPSSPAGYQRLAIAYKYAGNADSAQKYLDIARMYDPAFHF